MNMGQVYSLVLVSVTKRALQEEMPRDMRLEFLNHLEKMTDSKLTAKVISLVDPMDDRGYALFREAAKLGFKIVFDPGTGRRPDAFSVLFNKFPVFVELNPSLKTAYDEACQPWGGSYDSLYSNPAKTGSIIRSK